MSHFSFKEKSARVAGQVSAQLGGHVSSSTLSAHHMARAGVAAHSSPDGELTWVDDNNVTWMLLDTANGLYWTEPCHAAHAASAMAALAVEVPQIQFIVVGVPVLYMVVGPCFGRLPYFLRECGLRQFFLRAPCVWLRVYGCFWKNFAHSCRSP